MTTFNHRERRGHGEKFRGEEGTLRLFRASAHGFAFWSASFSVVSVSSVVKFRREPKSEHRIVGFVKDNINEMIRDLKDTTLAMRSRTGSRPISPSCRAC